MREEIVVDLAGIQFQNFCQDAIGEYENARVAGENLSFKMEWEEGKKLNCLGSRSSFNESSQSFWEFINNLIQSCRKDKQSYVT